MDVKQKILEKLIKEGEGENLEFKQKISDKNKISKTITSFANNTGGIILVGIKDDKTINNIDPEEEKYMLNEAANFHCDPPIELIFEEIEEGESGKTILLVHVPESNTKPHSCKTSNGWKIYLRQKDHSTLASELNISLMRKGMSNEATFEGFTSIETSLVFYLRNNNRITLKEYMKLVNISKRRAQRILTNLVIIGIIKVYDHEKEHYYTL